eukprot:7205708-Pyramimonas_sp.AAC.1
MLAILEIPQPGRIASPADGAPDAADPAEQVGEVGSGVYRSTKGWAATRPKESASICASAFLNWAAWAGVSIETDRFGLAAFSRNFRGDSHCHSL